MDAEPRLLLIASIGAVGVLHTVVPDHWLPIVLLARQRGWSRAVTARAALLAGAGHVGSTLLIGLLVWFAGTAVAGRFGRGVDAASSLALIGFGLWFALSAWRELRGAGGHGHAHPYDPGHDHDHDDHVWPPTGQGGAATLAADRLYVPLRGASPALTHVHLHRHRGGPPHLHWHDHAPQTAHRVTAETDREPPPHQHLHKTTARTALLLILGSSPMLEGVPLFFAASKYGAGLIAAMAGVFAAGTIATYLLLCVGSFTAAQRLRLGRWERYGEVLSGGFIALVGVAFWPWAG